MANPTLCGRGILPSGFSVLAILLGVAGTSAASGDGSGEYAGVRPDPEGTATRVSVSIYVLDVAEIDDTKRTFTADVYAIFRWKDARLASSDDARRTLPLTEVWHPDYLILNQRNVNRLLPELVAVDRQGNVEYRQRFQGAFSMHLDLRNFPLDEQRLAVQIVCPGQSPAELELIAAEHSGRAQEFSILDWSIGTSTNRAEPLVTPDGREIAGFTGALAVRRRTGAYVYQFIIPLIFIVGMSWAAFWMAPEQFGPRQALAVTSMLTIIAYRFVLVNQLPKVAYLTRFDYLLLGCTTLVFLALTEVVLAHQFTVREQLDRARKLDVAARCVFPALFLFLIVGASVL